MMRLCLVCMTLLAAVAVGAERQAAVLVIGNGMSRQGGGTALRRNMERLHRHGYRVAYHRVTDLADTPDDYVQRFDVVVLLEHQSANMRGDLTIPEVTLQLHEDLRRLLAAGGGVLCFNDRREGPMRTFVHLMAPYGVQPLSGILLDPNMIVATFGYVRYAYSREYGSHPLAAGLRGHWYPVYALRSDHTDLDIWRQPNTYPFRTDDNWQVLASAAPTTRFRPFRPDEAADTEFLQNPRRLAVGRDPVPLLAIRDGVEGAGRLAVCAVDSVYTDFIGGNDTYDGSVTGKGVNGRPSDFGTLLDRTLDWLAAKSLAAERDTLPASERASFAIEPFRFPEPREFDDLPGLLAQPEQYDGLVGARSNYSGGTSTVAEYAVAARRLGLDFLVFLEDFAKLDHDDFERLTAECREHSNNDLVLLPGIFIQTDLGIWYFGFRQGLHLPEESFLAPGTRKLDHFHFDGENIRADGVYNWVAANGHRYGIAAGNFRLDDKMPGGVPPSDYNFHNPFISLFTYRDGELVDSMMDTYRKCAGRTEWVSPIAIDFVDSADELARAWESDRIHTVYQRSAPLAAAFTDKVGERPGFAPISYVTNGPRIEEWRDSGFDCFADWYDWTRNFWRVRFVVSSDAGLTEVRVLDGEDEIRRFLPGGATRCEQELLLAHNDMQNLILVVTDRDGRQAISDELWCKNQLLQLSWCTDRNNCLAGSHLPAPKDPTGTTLGNWAAPVSIDKGAMRETLVPGINQNRSRLPGFDGQPHWPASIQGAPIIRVGDEIEGDIYGLPRDWARAICSPDVAIHNIVVRRRYDPSLTHPRPWTRGPQVPTRYFDLDMRYITFSHPGHWPAPVLVEATMRLKQDISFPADELIGLRLLRLNAQRAESGYDTAVVMHAPEGNYAGRISYAGEHVSGSAGRLVPYSYIYFYPSAFGSVGLMALEGDLVYRYRSRGASIGWNVAGRSFKAGDELRYRVLTFISGFDEPPTTRLPEALRHQLGLNPEGTVNYDLELRTGKVIGREYILRLDGDGVGAAGTLNLGDGFPCSLPIVVDNLNDRWTAVLYDAENRRLRVLGQTDGAAWCHQPPTEPRRSFFIGHPFVVDNEALSLSVMQSGTERLSIQIHNPTDEAVTTTLRRAPAFTFIEGTDRRVEIPAGSTVTLDVTSDGYTPR